ncbi:MAG: prolyl oligopeptidase family serine peptidase [Lutibacter sp.]|jgi:pimeloyl-ACP methyl ester carboxylesterase|nr:prolyl oligopeptidase family serine peptidase [Lutibacter sp.]
MKTYVHRHLIFRCFSLLLLVACSRESIEITDQTISNEWLVSYELTGSFTASQLQQTAAPFSTMYPVIAGFSYRDVKAYKLVYTTTDVVGTPISASGLVLIPQQDTPFPIVSFQHGTETDKEKAPSNAVLNQDTLLGLLVSGSGYVMLFPDYLGYGASKAYPHPYEHAATLGKTCYDMLMGAKEMFQELEVQTSEKLFLAGYSEGGYATMAMHKYLDAHSNIPVTMSAPGAGAYHKTAFAQAILEKDETLEFLPNYMWVLETYNWVYGVDRPWSATVNEPYATTLENIIDPGDYLTSGISKNPSVLFQASFRDAFLAGTDALCAPVADNDIHDWLPKGPITLYHGEEDDYVFPLNSQSAYEAMKARGASVSLVTFPGENHATAILPYLNAVVPLFESLK